MITKLAYQVGVKLALDDLSAGDELNDAAQKLYTIAGGLAGAAGGGFLGNRLGQQAADAFDFDEGTGGMVGAGLGALAGAGLGGFAGSNLATILRGQTSPESTEPAYEPLPEYPTVGLSPLEQLSQGGGFAPMEPVYDVTPSYAPEYEDVGYGGGAADSYSPEDVYSMGLSGYGDSYDSTPYIYGY